MIIDMTKLVLLTLVLHFIADFNLQIGAKLNDMKQKRWWKEELNKNGIFNTETCMYRNDWLCALLIHSFVWAVITFSPLICMTSNVVVILTIVLCNTIVHARIDHIKANMGLCSLVVDQLLHLVQIAGTLMAYVVATNLV